MTNFKSKKQIAWLLVLLLSFTMISGCANTTAPAEGTATATATGALETAPAEVKKGKFNEAPMFSQLVKEAKLEPVDERLPAEPLVYAAGTEVPVSDMPEIEIGKYGGVLRIVNPGKPGGGEYWGIGREPLLLQPGFGESGEKPKGNIFKDFDMSEDGKVFTFHMREGMRWSDGELFTSEDIRYAYEDVLLNEELTPVIPKWLSNSDGTIFDLEIVDKHTFRISFKEPYALFPYTLSLNWQTWDSGPLIQPSHYMKKFHIKYASAEELKSLLQKNELADNEWYTLHSLYSWAGGGRAQTKIGCPSLSAYVLEEMPSAQVAILRRNPYYWKVDTAGNQLPYIDEIRAGTVTSADMLPMEIMGGKVDFSRYAISIKELALYKENETKGNYSTKILKFHAPIAITFNYSNPDTAWSEILWDHKFREAINLAINREEIIDAVYNGFASPSKITPSEFDPEAAKKLLDSIGLNKKDSEGWRLRPDGKKMELLIETSADSTDFIPMIEIIVENWNDIGIHTRMSQIESSLLAQRVKANETQVIINTNIDLPVAQGNPYMLDQILLSDNRKTSEGFYQWYTTFGKEGLEPSDEFKPIYSIYNDMKASKSMADIGSYMKKWEQALHDSLFLIVPVEDIAIPLIVSDKLGNVPEKGYQIMANFAGEMLFYK